MRCVTPHPPPRVPLGKPESGRDCLIVFLSDWPIVFDWLIVLLTGLSCFAGHPGEDDRGRVQGVGHLHPPQALRPPHACLGAPIMRRKKHCGPLKSRGCNVDFSGLYHLGIQSRSGWPERSHPTRSRCGPSPATPVCLSKTGVPRS